MSNLDVSLDDLIKRNKSSSSRNPRPRTSGSGSSSGPGPRRRFPNRAANRPTPYSSGTVHAPETTWDHDMFAEQAPSYPAARGVGMSGIETGIKLLISNLDYGVSNEDIKELFSEAGDIKRYSIHYDKSGRSKGTAEVIFSRRRDAEAAIKRYNNVQLDGKPMKIDFAGTNVAPPALPPIRNRLYGNPIPAPRRMEPPWQNVKGRGSGNNNNRNNNRNDRGGRSAPSSSRGRTYPQRSRESSYGSSSSSSPVIQLGGRTLVNSRIPPPESSTGPSVHLKDIPEDSPLYGHLQAYLAAEAAEKQKHSFAAIPRNDIDDDMRVYEMVTKRKIIFFCENSKIQRKDEPWKILHRYLMNGLYSRENHKNPAAIMKPY